MLKKSNDIISEIISAMQKARDYKKNIKRSSVKNNTITASSLKHKKHFYFIKL
ncbi:MAG: hypothetical protein U0V72_14185 [Cytophagales bacterium]